MKWKILRHNGVAFPPPYDYRGLTVRITGAPVKLNSMQEEMLMAWAKKKDTPYVLDPVFQKNFLDDLKKELPGDYALADIDFTPLNQIADREKTANLSDAEKKTRAAERKAEREQLQAKYGTAMLDDNPVEISAYLVEPPGILMGRGNHPLRGKWKPRVVSTDVILNLDEDAPAPPVTGGWKKIVHEHDSMWVASWWDELAKKKKYIWLAETSHLRQERDQEKYLKAEKLEKNVARVRAEIAQRMEFENTAARAKLEQARAETQTKIKTLNDQIQHARESQATHELTKLEITQTRLSNKVAAYAKQADKIHADEMKTRQLATVCYLIDRLAMRVGDEKDEDEADTVGASTLRVEHLRFGNDQIGFDFLGKDSVRWEKSLPLDHDEQILARNLQDLTRGKPPGDQIFDQIDSTHVNKFLGDIVEGLTAKVFRTYHATHAVRAYLQRAGNLAADAPTFQKEQIAKLANLEAAIVCNHKRTPPKNWEASLKKREIEAQKLRAQKPDVEKLRAQIAPREKALEKLRAAQPDTEKLQALVRARQPALENARAAQTVLPKLEEQIKTRQAALDKLIAEQKKVEAVAQDVLKKRQTILAALEKQKPPHAKKAARQFEKRLRAARVTLKQMQKANDAKLKRYKTRTARARKGVDAAIKNERDKTRATAKRLAQAQAALTRAQDAVVNDPKRYEQRLARAQENVEKARRAPEIAQKNFQERVEKTLLQLDLATRTRDYNLGTSLKNYIDPRVYKAWSDHVEFDWKRLYTKALQKKFTWVSSARVKWEL